MQESSDIFNDVSNKYKFNAIIFSHTDQTPWANQFFIDIWNNNEWVPIYLDETIIIFIKNIEENKDLIDKFKIDKNNIKYNINTEEIMSYLQIASFFSKINSPEDELKIYDIILKKDPNNCLALRNSAIVSGQLNNNLGPLYASRYSASCK